MERISRCAVLALVLTGCATDVDGGEGGGSDDEGVPTTPVGGEPAPAFVGCPDVEGVPAAELLHQTPWGITSLLVNDEAIVYATERLADFPAQLVRLDRETNEIVEEDPVGDTITSMRQVGDQIIGGGYCISGGTPYVIGEGPLFTPLAAGCGGNPSTSLAFVGGGVAFNRDSSIRWAPAGELDSIDVVTFTEAKEGEMPPRVTQVTTDGSVVFASLTYTQIGANDSWGEIWRVPLDGSAPLRLAQTAFGASFKDGGIEWMVMGGEHIYFLDSMRGDLVRVHKAGGEPEVVWNGEHRVRFLADVGTHFAFLEQGDGQECATVVRAVPKGGGMDAFRVATLPGWAAGVFSDGTQLYSLGAVQADSGYQSGIFRAPPPP